MCKQVPISLIVCNSTSECPWLFTCGPDNSCQHLTLFETPILTSIVLLVIVIGVMFTNFAGLSAGVFKVPLFMAVLNYPTSLASYLTYPVVLGAGLSNFILLALKRMSHPTRVSSAVDYNLVIILIPSLCIGSAVGVICVNFVPLMVQDIVQIILFVLFSVFFFWRWATLKAKMKKQEALATERERAMVEMVEADSVSDRSDTTGSKDPKQTDYLTRQRLNDIIMYQSGYHWKEIIISFLIFVVFEFLSLVVSGLMILRYPANYALPMTFAILLFITTFVVFACFLYRHINNKLLEFAEIKYEYDLKLNKPQNFLKVVIGGILGGFFQGFLGFGSGDCMFTALLSINTHLKVASATIGYQMLFVGLSDTILALPDGSLVWADVGLLFGVTFVFGGMLTVVIYRVLWHKKQATKIILLVVAVLAVLNVAGTIPSLYSTNKYYEFAWTSPEYCPS